MRQVWAGVLFLAVMGSGASAWAASCYKSTVDLGVKPDFARYRCQALRPGDRDIYVGELRALLALNRSALSEDCGCAAPLSADIASYQLFTLLIERVRPMPVRDYVAAVTRMVGRGVGPASSSYMLFETLQRGGVISQFERCVDRELEEGVEACSAALACFCRKGDDCDGNPGPGHPGQGPGQGPGKPGKGESLMLPTSPVTPSVAERRK